MSDPTSGTLTFLFSDVEGSTALLRELGGDWRSALSAGPGRRSFASG